MHESIDHHFNDVSVEAQGAAGVSGLAQAATVSGDLGRLDDDANLASRLQRVRLRDAGLRHCDLLERRQPLDVVLEALAAGARPWPKEARCKRT